MSAGIFERFGFSENPFASTNADKEPNLSSYFVPPPYFASVRGDPSAPKSHVILAPRGAGKTAQKVMLEEYADAEAQKPFLCVTYDHFRSLSRLKASSVNLDWHLIQIIQQLSSAIVALIAKGHGINLSKSEKHVLSYCFSKFLGDISAADATRTFNSVRGKGEVFSEFISKNGSNLLRVASSIAAKWGFEKVEIDQVQRDLKDESLEYIFERLVAIVRSFGFHSVYVLIDRVDEITELNGDAGSAAKFIEPLSSNIHLLETDGVAFKLFLWDKMEEHMTASGFRRDRIPVNVLNWSTQELEEMLSKRLSSFSGGSITSFNQIVEP